MVSPRIEGAHISTINRIADNSHQFANEKRTMLNLGCGGHFHRDWINVDLTPIESEVLPQDLRTRFPFADDSCDVIYHSHVLEHLSRSDGLHFLRECFRVCRKGGVIRVVVPDLEDITRLYLHYLNQSLDGQAGAENRYSWMLLELYDQMVRTAPGGEMAVYLRNAPSEMTEFLLSRVGKNIFLSCHTTNASRTHAKRIFRLFCSPKSLWYHIRRVIILSIVIVLWGRGGLNILKEVLFRLQGEIHRCMYDRHSLRIALEQAGFSQVKLCSAAESSIKEWQGFELDIGADGTVFKPNSLFMEAIK